jgi:FtsH-binding integral membrane protein
MPIKTYRATSRFIGAGIAGNLGIGMALCAVVTVLAALLNTYVGGRGSSWGHVAAIAFMLLGILMMMKAQEGYVPPEAPDED